jgi:2-hydroxychromene-2-carboxylate isomerase
VTPRRAPFFKRAEVCALAQPVFYFDFNSPYAYLAAARIDDFVPDAEWRPIAFPILLHQLGRLEHVLQRDFPNVLPEVRARAAARGLPPVEPPPGWPVESWSLAPLRATVFAAEQGAEREFARTAFDKVFVESRSLVDPDTLRDVAAEAGLEPDEVLAAIERPDIKQRLKDQTNAAVERGITGIPTFEIGDELYWGDDHLEEAAAALARPT